MANLIIRAKQTGVGSTVAYVNGAGEETDISDVISAVEVHTQADGLTTAVLHGLFVESQTEAFVEDVFLRVIPRDLIPKVIVRLRELYATPDEVRRARGDTALLTPANRLGQNDWARYYAEYPEEAREQLAELER